jgi:hypothetical protein
MKLLRFEYPLFVNACPKSTQIQNFWKPHSPSINKTLQLNTWHCDRYQALWTLRSWSWCSHYILSLFHFTTHFLQSYYLLLLLKGYFSKAHRITIKKIISFLSDAMVLLPLHTVHKEVSLNHSVEKITLTLKSHISHTQTHYNLKYASSFKFEPFLTCLPILV